MEVPFSYLKRQFANPDAILEEIRHWIVKGTFTLGEPVERFERAFAELIGVKHAIAVGSGTDALFLSLKAMGIGAGDEVITAVNTFVATAGAIETSGARIRFVDCDSRFVMDPEQLEAAVTPRTKAIIPVHYTGQPADMDAIEAIARKHGLAVIEDACTAIDGSYRGRRCGAMGRTAAFSLHPLKNLNVWGDGGLITTGDDDLMEKLKLLRNHGMRNRDVYEFYAYNSRLDTIQAVVGLHLIKEAHAITERRIAIAQCYDRAFRECPGLTVPPRSTEERHVYHLYIIQSDRRDALLKHLKAKGISAKIHYPIPLHLQPASAHLGYAKGDFPVAEAQAQSMISLPAHQHLSQAEVDYVIDRVTAFQTT